MRFLLSLFVPFVHALLPTPHHYYPLATSGSVRAGKASAATLFDKSIVLTRDVAGNIKAYQDGCPHRGASFDNADTGADGGPICLYHGFCFDGKGVLQCGVGTTPGSAKLQTLCATESDGLIWVCLGIPQHAPPAPLHHSPKSRTITGVYRMKCDMSACVENILDCTHLSIHSFGNKQDPEPKNYTVKRISSTSSEATFDYSSGPTSASKTLLKADMVKVHNWYVVPSTAVTTVVAGPGTKTVRVHVSPTGKRHSTMFWSLTRDFVTTPLLDSVAHFIMEKTLDEDKVILEKLIDGMEGSMHGVYDKLGLFYRHDMKKSMEHVT